MSTLLEVDVEDAIAAIPISSVPPQDDIVEVRF